MVYNDFIKTKITSYREGYLSGNLPNFLLKQFPPNQVCRCVVFLHLWQGNIPGVSERITPICIAALVYDMKLFSKIFSTNNNNNNNNREAFLSLDFHRNPQKSAKKRSISEFLHWIFQRGGYQKFKKDPLHQSKKSCRP